MPAFVYDLIILALLALFAWRGAAKGLILSLCGLAATFVAFFGALFISNQFSAPLAEVIKPIIVQNVEDFALSSLSPSAPASGSSPAPGSTPAPSAAPSLPGDLDLGSIDLSGYTADELLDAIRDADLPPQVEGFLENFVTSDGFQDFAEHLSGLDPVDAIAGKVAASVARVGLFALSYFLILLIWFLVSHALDLAAHLPVLSQLNQAGGLVFGLLEAVFIAVILVWLGQAVGFIPAQPETPVLSLFTVDALKELLGTVAG